jgi:hypothetical protein
MAKRKGAASSAPSAPADERVRQLERIAKLLAVLAVKGENQTDKIVTLAAVGFTPAETSQLLGTTPNTVAVTVSKHKRERAKRGPRTRNN